MKITGIRTYVLDENIEEPFAFSQWWHRARQACIVQIVTDEGVTGWGEANAPAYSVRSTIEKVFAPLLLGENPMLTLAIWERLYTRAKVFGQGGIAMAAISAIDIALWDFKAKFLKVPIYQLIGGQIRSKVKAYATGFFLREGGAYPGAFVDEAIRHMEGGFTAMKVKMGFWGPRDDLRALKTICAALGKSKPEIMVDANGAYDENQARRIGIALEALNVTWFEEPIPKSNIAGYIRLRNSLLVAIAGGETLVDRYQFRDWIRRGALGIAQPDLCKAGGITEGQRILSLASSYDTMVVPHVWGTSIAMAAALQFMCVIPDYPTKLTPSSLLFEYDTSNSPFRDQVLATPIRVENGFIAVPSQPGLGIEVNADFLDRQNRT